QSGPIGVRREGKARAFEPCEKKGVDGCPCSAASKLGQFWPNGWLKGPVLSVSGKNRWGQCQPAKDSAYNQRAAYRVHSGSLPRRTIHVPVRGVGAHYLRLCKGSHAVTRCDAT